MKQPPRTLALITLLALLGAAATAQAPAATAPAASSPVSVAPATTPSSAAAPAAAAAPAGPPAAIPAEVAELLGLNLAAALARFGAPSSVGAVRGPEPWQDDVVFAYPGDWYLSWAGDRVWQARFGRGYRGPVFGLYLGDPIDKAWALLGEPYWKDEQSLVWRLPWKGYPVRLRAWIEADRVVDLYVYRADF